MSAILVVIPTYNELESLPGLLRRLLAAVPAADVLVVDDGSPDGTGEWAEEFASARPQVHVLHRSGKQGLGTAYIAGFHWALERGYEVVCEMDADGSHQPEQLRRLLVRLDKGFDLVIGSRWVRGGRIVNWPLSRQLLSRGGNWYTRMALGMHVRDATAGYRAFRAAILSALPLDDVASQGYCFQVDMTRRVLDAGGRVSEVPITFVERAQGQSKMSSSIVREALWSVMKWGVQKRACQVAGLFTKGGSTPVDS